MPIVVVVLVTKTNCSMENRIEKYIRKAKTYSKSILQGEKKDLHLDNKELEAIDTIESKIYETWREAKVKDFDREESWENSRVVSSQKKSKTIQLLRHWKSVAAVLVIFLLGTEAYFIVKDIQKEDLNITPGKSIAYLEIDKNKHIELSSRDTLLLFEEAKAQIDSGSIVYSSTEARTKKNEYHKINVPRNGEYYVELSDGTKVWMNSESSLGFYSKFSDKARIVRLEGEAYFEVSKDKSRPFIVKTGDMDVRVLGTEFNVKSYPNDDHVFTTLKEGKVRVRVNDMNQTLLPNDQLVLNKQTGDIEKRQVNATIYSAWKDGMFVFKDERLEDILQAFSRWYDVEVFYPNSKMKEELFSMRVNRYEDINVILKKMEKTGVVHFELNKNALIVK